MDQKIVLDEQSFKALSADSRVSILKSLGERRRTLSELSQKLTLGNSTVKEHCDILVNANLIKQIDEGRKWKYYELTQKGKQIITPNLMDEVKVLIVLCIGVIMIGAVTFFSLQLFSTGGAQTFTANSISAPMLEKNTVLDQTNITAIASTGVGATSAKDTNETATTGAGTTATNNSNTAQESICPSAQCSITSASGITQDFFLISTMISILFGIALGWAVTRKRF